MRPLKKYTRRVFSWACASTPIDVATGANGLRLLSCPATRHQKSRDCPVYACIKRSIAPCLLPSSKAAIHLHAPTALSPRLRPHQWGVKFEGVERSVETSSGCQHCRDASFWESVILTFGCCVSEHSSTKSRASTFLLEKAYGAVV